MNVDTYMIDFESCQTHLVEKESPHTWNFTLDASIVQWVQLLQKKNIEFVKSIKSKGCKSFLNSGSLKPYDTFLNAKTATFEALKNH